MRSLLRSAVAGAAALAAAAVAGPAYAADAPRVSVAAPAVTVAAGFDAKVFPVVSSAHPADVSNPKMVFELSGDLDRVTMSNAAYNDVLCHNDGPHKMTCGLDWDTHLNATPRSLSLGALLSAPAAAGGESGTLKSTFSADGVAPVSTTSAVTVGEAVELAAGDSVETTAGLGGPFDTLLSVRNNGAGTAHGVAVTFENDYAFQPRETFSNCRYDADQLTSCVFDQDLAPGRSYAVTVPYRVRANTRAPINAYGLFTWLTKDDYANLGSQGTPGTGSKLTLAERPGVKAAPKQTDPHPVDNQNSITVAVTGKQGADLVAIGTTVHATAGRTVPLTVGVRNDGPGADDRTRRFRDNHGDPAAVAVITPPAGSTVTKMPDDCHQATDRNEPTRPGVTQYFCTSPGLLVPDATKTWTFQLKVTKAGTGLVEINPRCECDRFSADTDKSNDTAKIVVDVTGAAGGDGTGGGGLAITGPKSIVAGGAGALLVLLGAAGFVLARRRRTRFEA